MISGWIIQRRSAANRTNLELKCYASGAVLIEVNTANRTNLELKFIVAIVRSCRLHPANRTNLELKFTMSPKRATAYQLPIAPIWNWNFRNLNLIDVVDTANRTNLELKFDVICSGTNAKFPANRTNLELKSGVPWACNSTVMLPIAPIWNWNRKRFDDLFWGQAANRTNLELKFIIFKRDIIAYVLPIAPIWNWNEICVCRQDVRNIVCQSHQSGIEIFFIQLANFSFNTANRTNLELKFW